MRSYLLGKCGSASCMDEPQVAQQRKYEAEISIKVSPNHEACNECGESTGSRHRADMPKIVTGKVNGKLLQLVRQQGDLLVKVNPDINGFDEWCVGGDNRGILVGTPTDTLRKYRMA